MLRGLQHTPRWPYRSLALASQRSTMAAAEPIHRRTEPPHKCRIIVGAGIEFARGTLSARYKLYRLLELWLKLWKNIRPTTSISLDTSQCCGCCSY